ncbi:MAG TPA: hypothetical protein VHQ87_01305 [Rhizobacter sp.]|jgi:hypothetical protein|nr:hypothetical protein [Rhizobacter sp.]
MMLFRWLRCARRGHQPVFVRNIYGDEIDVLNARSIWRCANCEREILQKDLYRGKDYRA